MVKINHKHYKRAYVRKAVVKTKVFNGAVVGVHLVPTSSNSFIKKLQHWLPILFLQRVYFWLPYKHMVVNGNYGQIGPASRAPYGNTWFQIKRNHPLSVLSTLRFKKLVLRTNKDYQKANLKISFLNSDLIKASSKPLKRELDKILLTFIDNNQNGK